MVGNLSLWREKCVSMLPSASSWTLVMRRDVGAASSSFGASWTLQRKMKYLSVEVAVVADALDNVDLSLDLGLSRNSLVRVVEVFTDGLPMAMLMNGDRTNSIWGVSIIKVRHFSSLEVLSDMMKFPDDDLTYGDVVELCEKPTPNEGE